jgi:N-acyl-L-homoserine lactone synthetase
VDAPWEEPAEVAALPMLAIADMVAREALSRAAPVRFGLARAPKDLEAVWRLRYEVVREKGWSLTDDLAEGLERDTYDEVALHVVARREGRCLATARLVLPRADRPLPTEQAFEVEVLPRGVVVDCSRLAVARPERGGWALLAGLLACCWLECRARGFWRLCGAAEPAVLRLYGLLGVRTTLLGPSRLYWQKERFPVAFDLASSVAGALAPTGSGKAMLLGVSVPLPLLERRPQLRE